MQSFSWNSYYVTGIASVDEQHERLVALINRFGEQVTSEQTTQDDIAAVVAELREYSEYHFREEEALMRDGGLPAAVVDGHCRMHREFVREVELAAKDLHNLSRSGVRQLHDYLVYWLGYHILGSDQGMARQLSAIASGTSPDEALRIEQERDEGALQPLLDSIVGLLHVVQDKNHEMQQINATLEERVVARTAELERAHQAMQQMAMHDALTGLPNRRMAMEFMELNWSERGDAPFSCLMIDADYFKAVNDQYGHEAGDEVLLLLAREITAAGRTDDLPCRLGGDEFLLLCPRTPLSGARILAENLLKAVSGQIFTVGEGQWRGSLSIGVAERRPEMTAAVDLLRAADHAVYAAKAGGRDTFCCQDDAAA